LVLRPWSFVARPEQSGIAKNLRQDGHVQEIRRAVRRLSEVVEQSIVVGTANGQGTSHGFSASFSAGLTTGGFGMKASIG
jgi:hypothetical protein